jgi:hypothetical protein
VADPGFAAATSVTSGSPDRGYTAILTPTPALSD